VRTIDDYFSSLARFIANSPSIVQVEPASPFHRITDFVGRVEARLHFFDGSYLDVGEMVRIEQGAPLNFHYRYHWQRPEGPVWTYDDAPHHPELPTFPFHRHQYQRSRRTAEAHPRIRLTEVIQEVLGFLAGERSD
jgi:hypothetical protein